MQTKIDCFCGKPITGVVTRSHGGWYDPDETIVEDITFEEGCEDHCIEEIGKDYFTQISEWLAEEAKENDYDDREDARLARWERDRDDF